MYSKWTHGEGRAILTGVGAVPVPELASSKPVWGWKHHPRKWCFSSCKTVSDNNIMNSLTKWWEPRREKCLKIIKEATYVVIVKPPTSDTLPNHTSQELTFTILWPTFKFWWLRLGTETLLVGRKKLFWKQYHQSTWGTAAVWKDRCDEMLEHRSHQDYHQGAKIQGTNVC